MITFRYILLHSWAPIELLKNKLKLLEVRASVMHMLSGLLMSYVNSLAYTFIFFGSNRTIKR